jgi:hypothetical protein
MRRATTMVLAAAVAASAAGCGLFGSDPEFSEGDCVTVQQGIVDSDIESADCAGAQGTFNAAERIYRVAQVIDGTSGDCPVQGFFPVTFVHEPDDVTYCLVQADGSEGDAAG